MFISKTILWKERVTVMLRDLLKRAEKIKSLS